jgi:RNA polymerase sigma-70 factor (ECF subfamily)
MVSLDRSTANDHDGQEGGWSERIIGNVPDPHQTATERENSHWVHDSVASLGESMQQVVNLVYYQGLKYREAAEVLGIPVGTVKSRLHAAVQRLGILWDETHEPETDEEIR